MDLKKKRIDKVTVIAALVLAALLISLIPVIYASFFSHPRSDDYSNSCLVYDAVRSGGSVLKAAAQTAAATYRDWQGTYTANFILALQPGAFSDSLYFLTTFIMPGALCGSTFFLFDTR